MSAFDFRCSVLFSRLLFVSLLRLQVSTCFIMQIDDVRNACPTHHQCFSLISSLVGSWFILSRSRLLLTVSGQWVWSILSRQLFINTCTFLIMVVVILHVSAPYNKTVSTFVLKILTLSLVDNCLEFLMFFNCRNAVLSLPISAFVSTLDFFCSWMMQFRYVKISTFSTAYLSSTILLVLIVLYFSVLHVPLCMLGPTASEAVATPVISMSDLRDSVGVLFDPAASHLLIFSMPLLIYSIFDEVTGGLYVLTWCPVGLVRVALFKSSSKCSNHLFPCSWIAVIGLPFCIWLVALIYCVFSPDSSPYLTVVSYFLFLKLVPLSLLGFQRISAYQL